MRHIRISRLLALSAVFDLLQSIVGLLLSLIFVVVFTMTCFMLSGFLLAALVDGTLYGLLGWNRPALMPGSLMTGNFAYDTLSVFYRGGGIRLPVMMVVSLGMLAGLLVARKIRAMRLKPTKLALLLVVFVLHIIAGLPALQGESGNNPWLLAVMTAFLPVLVGMNIGNWLADTLRLDLESTIQGVVGVEGMASVLAMTPTLALCFVLSYLWVECLRALTYLADGEYRLALWRSLSMRRLALPRVHWPRWPIVLRSALPVLGAITIAAAFAGACIGAVVLIAENLSSPWLILVFRQSASLFGNSLSSVAYIGYLCIGAVAALSWISARMFGKRLDVFVEVLGWCCVMVGAVWLMDRLPDAEIRNKHLPVFAFMVGPGIIVALVLRSVIWLGLVRGWERWQAALQPPLTTREDAGPEPALYLRAFKDDHLTMSGGFDLLDFLLGRLRRHFRFEEIIAGRILTWRPVVALGNPHVAFQFYGALKRQVDDSDWQQEVAYWNEHSVYAVMIANQTENVGWEVALIKSTARDRRAIFVLTNSNMAQQFFEHYQLLPQAEESAIPKSALITYFDPEYGWTCIEAWRRNYAGYSIAMDIALSRVEWHLRRRNLPGADGTAQA